MSSDVTFQPEKAIEEALKLVGISSARIRKGELGHCATFILPDHSLFVRVGRIGTEVQASQNVQFAQEMSKNSSYILRPADVGVDQPIANDYGLVTFWPLLDEDLSPKTEEAYETLGRALQEVHGSQLGEHGIDFQHRRTPISIAKRRIDKYAASPFSTKVLTEKCESLFDEIDALLTEVEPLLDHSVIHGDAYPQNVVVTHGGEYFLIDYDSAGIGSVLWDLAPMSVLHKRLGVTDDQMERFLIGYGSREHLSKDTFKKILRVRELGVVTAIIERASQSRVYAEELAYRIATLSDPDVRWTTVAELNRRDLEEGVKNVQENSNC